MVALGSPTVLHCYVIGWPRPKVIWWRGDQILPLLYGQYEQRRDSSLLVKAISLRDLGPYVCQAYNGLGKAVSGTVTVQAIGPVYSNNPEDEPFFQYVVSAPQRPIESRNPYRPFHPYPQTTPVPPAVHAETTPIPHPPEPQPPQPEAPRVYRGECSSLSGYGSVPTRLISWNCHSSAAHREYIAREDELPGRQRHFHPVRRRRLPPAESNLVQGRRSSSTVQENRNNR